MKEWIIVVLILLSFDIAAMVMLSVMASIMEINLNIWIIGIILAIVDWILVTM